MLLGKKQKRLRSNSLDILIAGLGNPGLRYTLSRHNVGFMMTELLTEQLVLSLRKPLFRSYEYGQNSSGHNTLHIVKPLTYMNRSGEILPAIMKKNRVEPSGLIVVTDNMDLPIGRIRMKPGGSSAGHNGLKSVMTHVGSSDFYRLYIGIGRPAEGESVVDHVLGNFTEEQMSILRDIHYGTVWKNFFS